jgi:DNA-directed RNA polymerase omega subunit
MAKKKSAKKPQVKQQPKPEQRVVNLNPELDVEEQIPLNELPTIFPNSYEAVVAAARRARQLNLGLKPLVRTRMQRPVDVALAELAAKKVEYAVDEDEVKFIDPPTKAKPRSKKS